MIQKIKIVTKVVLSTFLTGTFFSLIFCSLAFAQATRTWVSGVGDDANPCSRTAPCKTFAGAISKTAAAGVINTLDGGGFGAVTITKSITIENETATGGVLAAGVNGVIINAGVNDVIVLKGLTIDGVGTGLNGVRFLAGGTLYIENCTINNFSQKGIDFEPSATSSLFVKDTTVRNNPVVNGGVGGGIFIKPGVSGVAKVSIDGVRLERNLYGVRAEIGSKVTINNSSVAGNINNGILGVAASGTVDISVANTTVTNTGINGISSVGAGVIIRIGNVTVTNNGTGLDRQASGQILSFSNNSVDGNTSNGTPSGSVSQL